MISEKIWIEAQGLLAQEKARARRSYKLRRSLMHNAINHLRTANPKYSAARTFTVYQAVGVLLACICIGFLSFTNFNLLAFSGTLILTGFYLANILMRGLLLAEFDESTIKSKSIIPAHESNLPVYSILVALYQEPEQISGLTEHLWKLNWPKEKLDIKLVCEADDLETIYAIKNEGLPDCFDLVLVPPTAPRTKPKALNYALPLAHGQFLVLYDAEDRPEPDQLREAYGRFVTGDREIACLQAPLHIHNDNQNWLCQMFAIEYLTLFNGILPVLAKWRVPLPLGGTSNHFKTEILRKVGAWDPFNVTEDADLGIRLYREGYRCETLSMPTYEEAPSQILPWLRQRTRWIKGWMQTILVHNRNPIEFSRNLGIKKTLAFHLFLTSLVISVLIHPIFLFLSIYQVVNLTFTNHSPFDTFLLGTSVFNLVGGYTTYALLAFAVLKTLKTTRSARYLVTLPVYWLIISIAGWRAVVHLIVKPHKWEKTPHGLANTEFGLTVE
ncbi:MAG: glycosyltransferase family 2 protein [Rhizobiaceae bacterium]